MPGPAATMRQLIQQDVFDYQTLIVTLHNYSSPRDKISGLAGVGVKSCYLTYSFRAGLFCSLWSNADRFERQFPVGNSHIANGLGQLFYFAQSLPKRHETVQVAKDVRQNERYGESLSLLFSDRGGALAFAEIAHCREGIALAVLSRAIPWQ